MAEARHDRPDGRERAVEGLLTSDFGRRVQPARLLAGIMIRHAAARRRAVVVRSLVACAACLGAGLCLALLAHLARSGGGIAVREQVVDRPPRAEAGGKRITELLVASCRGEARGDGSTLEAGRKLAVPARLTLAGCGSAAELTAAGNARLLLAGRGDLRISPSGNGMDVALAAGLLRVDMDADAWREAPWTFRAPLGRVAVRGTVFELLVRPQSTRLSVERGGVLAWPDDGTPVLPVEAGAFLVWSQGLAPRVGRLAEVVVWRGEDHAGYRQLLEKDRQDGSGRILSRPLEGHARVQIGGEQDLFTLPRDDFELHFELRSAQAREVHIGLYLTRPFDCTRSVYTPYIPVGTGWSRVVLTPEDFPCRYDTADGFLDGIRLADVMPPEAAINAIMLSSGSPDAFEVRGLELRSYAGRRAR